MGAVLESWKLGLDIEQIKIALMNFKRVPGRFEQFKLKNQNHVIVDYAHSPDAFKNILSNVRSLTKKNIVTIFGCGGDRDKTKRSKMGAIAEEYSDFVYITNDNPRFENEDSIIRNIVSGFRTNKYSIIKNRTEALNEVFQKTENKIIVILGKGRDRYQIIGDEKKYYSDIDIVQEYLDED